jgi:hypothetical protein
MNYASLWLQNIATFLGRTGEAFSICEEDMNEDIKVRFWAKVKKGGGDECWPWTATKTKNGYGQLNISGKMCSSHRISKAIDMGLNHPGEIALSVLHSCDNPSCCNPSHLFLGSQKDNMDDMVGKQRQQRGERNGLAKLTEAKVLKARRLYATGNYTQGDIANILHVSASSMSSVIKRKTWKHI